ncbi:hypothetical protein AAFF_G00071930 [Aldrovandia affinis]|uniref:Uncharacterized protein n=1 Tax=Aldrovandia affinis TaxID=143900 RepID=A0AAD7RYK4_9TELE|nr:hypothetical protein AAFF_G00071930 [Aldrovandia affinis]
MALSEGSDVLSDFAVDRKPAVADGGGAGCNDHPFAAFVGDSTNTEENPSEWYKDPVLDSPFFSQAAIVSRQDLFAKRLVECMPLRSGWGSPCSTTANISGC